MSEEHLKKNFKWRWKDNKILYWRKTCECTEHIKQVWVIQRCVNTPEQWGSWAQNRAWYHRVWISSIPNSSSYFLFPLLLFNLFGWWGCYDNLAIERPCGVESPWPNSFLWYAHILHHTHKTQGQHIHSEYLTFQFLKKKKTIVILLAMGLWALACERGTQEFSRST